MTSGALTRDYSGPEVSTRLLTDDPRAAYEVVCPDTTAITRDEWLEMRRPFLCGSEIAQALGLSPYGGPYSLWLDKVEGVDAQADSEYKKWGHRLESPIAIAFWEETGFEVIHQPVMLRSKTCPFAAANPDRFCVADDGLAIVEIKNVDRFRKDEWADGPPLHYRLQGQWYLLVTGFKRVYFAALIGGNDFNIFRVERDDDLIAELVRKGEAFWSLVTLKRPPDVDGSDSTTDALRAQYAQVERPSIEGGTALAALVVARESAKAVADTAATRLQELDNRIVALIGDAEVATVDGQPVATRKQHERVTVDLTALKRDHPEIAREYSKTSTYRRLNIPKLKEIK